MKRMICIGAQCIDVAEMTVQLAGVEILCRRDNDPNQLRLFIGGRPIDQSATDQVQLSLFEERVECVGL
jgi:hypothetical protein